MKIPVAPRTTTPPPLRWGTSRIRWMHWSGDNHVSRCCPESGLGGPDRGAPWRPRRRPESGPSGSTGTPGGTAATTAPTHPGRGPSGRTSGTARRATPAASPGRSAASSPPPPSPPTTPRTIDEQDIRRHADRLRLLACGDGGVHALVGFFNAGTVNEWRTPNTIALRLHGRGDVFYAYVEYATGRWRAGGRQPRGFARSATRRPARTSPGGSRPGPPTPGRSATTRRATKGGGVVTATIGGETAVCHLDAGTRPTGRRSTGSACSGDQERRQRGEVWLDDVTINGDADDFDATRAGRGWATAGRTRRRTSARGSTSGTAPPTSPAARRRASSGGLVFRGDCREAARLASYGDRVGPLALDRPLRASGKVALRRGVSDSTTLLGFYHSEQSLAVNPSQSSGFPEGFLGVAVEGPSREGFFFYPAYRTAGDGRATPGGRPAAHPPGRQAARLVAGLRPGGGRRPRPDGGDVRRASRSRSTSSRATGLPATAFDRFGLVTTWIDGNGQTVYFDDLTYTDSQDEGGRD